MQNDAIIAKCINAYDSQFLAQDGFYDDFTEDSLLMDSDDYDTLKDFSDINSTGPTDKDLQELEKIIAQDKKGIVHMTDPLSLGVSKAKRSSIKPINYCFYALRKKIYEYNGEKKSPIIANDSTEVQCRHCGKTHIISDMILKGEENDHSDAIYSLLNLYDFAKKCSCGKYIYGYFKEPETPDWLDNLVEPKKKSTKKTTTATPKKQRKEVPENYQLSLFDLPELSEESCENANITTTTIRVNSSNVPTLEEKLNNVACLNDELSIICDKVYAMSSYNEEIAAFEGYKMKALIDEAKARNGIKNFMRMLKKEIISCIVLYDHIDTDENSILFNELSEKVQTRTAWLYGKYKDIK